MADELARAAAGEIHSPHFTEREAAFCAYARKLTAHPDSVSRRDIEPLRQIGLDDAGVLDLNQIVAYFAYANRTVLGLGVRVDGEPLGTYPDEDEKGKAFQHR